MKLYSKIIIISFLIVLSTVCLVTLITGNNLKAFVHKNLIENTRLDSKKIVYDLESIISLKLEETKKLASDYTFNILSKNTIETNDQLIDLNQHENSFNSITFYDNQNQVIFSSRSKNIELPKKQLLSTLSFSYNSDFGMYKNGDKTVIYFVSPIKENSQNKSGYVLTQIHANELLYDINSFLLEKKLIYYLINDKNKIIFTSSKTSNSNSQDFILSSKIESASYQENDATLFFPSDVSTSIFNKKNWRIVLSVPTTSYSNLFKIFFSIIPWLLLITIFFSLIFSLIAKKFIVKPILTLSRSAQELRRGNIRVKIPIGNDEIGKLGKLISLTSRNLIKKLHEQRALNKKLYDQKSQIEIQKNQLEFISNQIGDSISYAERIQLSTLPPLSSLQKVFPKSFVIYKPKDIIGGDFYWFERVRKGNNEFMIVACGDCTGHGVPGAIMSIMGSNQITNVVYYQNYLEPHKIISRLDKIIKFELQKNNEETNMDGMEIGICVIDLDTLKLQFSGVGIPLKIFRHEIKELEIYKTSHQMVGDMTGTEQEVQSKLKKEVIQLQPKDRIFLSTDGFKDQFGGPRDKKFLEKNFKKLIEDSSHEPIIDQAKTIEKSFLEWSKNTSQTDDVCVIGFEVQ